MPKLVDVAEVIVLEESDQGAIIIVREKEVPPKELQVVIEELSERFPGKQFFLLIGENIEVVKI